MYPVSLLRPRAALRSTVLRSSPWPWILLQAFSLFLFLGYTMADWNLRVVLHRLWGDQPLSYHSWAVQPEQKPLEREFWHRRDVDVFELPFDEYVEILGGYLAARPASASA